MAPSSVLYALCLLFLVSTEGRRLLQTTNTTSRTHFFDVNGLITLIDQFPQLSGAQFPSYTNDPCYPVTLSWIECSSDYPLHRVTALYLDYHSLSGYLPDFSDMNALERIELQGNYLRRSIPEFLGNFPELTYLNLAYNYFTGQLPYSLVNNKIITYLNVDGNTGLYCSSSSSYSCSSPDSPPIYDSIPDIDVPDRKKPKIKIKKLFKILFGAILAGIVILLGTICACCCPKKKEPAPAPALAPAPADTTAETAPGASAT